MEGLVYVYLAAILLLAITVHEFCHATAAMLLGDNTARDEGRVSLNPLRHLDIAGTVFFLLFHFGWGKPVPVNPMNFKNPRRDNALVAAAGPLSNLVMAGVFAASFHNLNLLAGPWGDLLRGFLYLAVQVNVMLALFNLLPFPPLDGGAIFTALLPDQQLALKIQQVGPKVFLGVILLNLLLGGQILGVVFFPLVQLVVQDWLGVRLSP